MPRIRPTKSPAAPVARESVFLQPLGLSNSRQKQAQKAPKELHASIEILNENTAGIAGKADSFNGRLKAARTTDKVGRRSPRQPDLRLFAQRLILTLDSPAVIVRRVKW